MKRARDTDFESNKPSKRHRIDDGHSCSSCGKTYHYLSRLETHQRWCTAAPVKCKDCDKTYSHPRSLQRHLISRHSKSIYECDACSLSFNTSKQYNKHMIRHIKVDPTKHQCPDCLRTFSKNTALRAHVDSLTACLGKPSTIVRESESSDETIHIDDSECDYDDSNIGVLVEPSIPTFDFNTVHLAIAGYIDAIVVTY